MSIGDPFLALLGYQSSCTLLPYWTRCGSSRVQDSNLITCNINLQYVDNIVSVYLNVLV